MISRTVPVIPFVSFSGGQISIQHNRRCVGKDSENLTQTDKNLGYPWIFGEIVVSLQRPHDPRSKKGDKDK